MKVVTVVGARPQFVKASVVSRVMASTSGVTEAFIHTGQHYDQNMSGIFFSELGMPSPAYDLGIGSGPHGQMTGRMLEPLERVMVDERPDWVLVYGDTNSTLAGALAAVKLHIPVAHVEAGLRSFNRRMPEEINRVLTDHVSSLLFTPTDTATKNLAIEGIRGGNVQQVGDIMFDAVKYARSRLPQEPTIIRTLGVEAGHYALVTVHRAENTDDPVRLEAIVEGVISAAQREAIVWPLHPRTRAAVEQGGMLDRLRRAVKVIDPAGYMDMLALEQSARVIATDSGGVQKEAYFVGVPCITLRDETEWVELLEIGANRLVPPTSASAVSQAINAEAAFPNSTASPFGDGRAGEYIVRALVEG